MKFLPRMELSQGEEYVINQEATPADARALREYLEHQGRSSKLALLNRNRLLRSKEGSDRVSVNPDLHAMVNDIPVFYWYG